MTKKTLPFLLLTFSIFLSGCFHIPTPQSINTESINETRTGKLTSGGASGLYLLISGPGQTIELHDGAIELAPYVGQSIEVTGQFSGTTLYVDEVRVLP